MSMQNLSLTVIHLRGVLGYGFTFADFYDLFFITFEVRKRFCIFTKVFTIEGEFGFIYLWLIVTQVIFFSFVNVTRPLTLGQDWNQ